jgi:hypothetical protein
LDICKNWCLKLKESSQTSLLYRWGTL